jgi:hypothetical protein
MSINIIEREPTRSVNDIYVTVGHSSLRDEYTIINIIEQEPTRSGNDIYSSLRDKYTRPMSEDCTIAFIQEIPTFEMCHSRLYEHRKSSFPELPGVKPNWILNQHGLVRTMVNIWPKLTLHCLTA